MTIQTSSKLLDQVRDAIRLKHYSLKTEETYVDWIKRCILFHKTPDGTFRPPQDMGASEINLWALWSEMQPYQDEPWCKNMIETACNALPLFKHYWTHLNGERKPPPQVIMRPELPIALNLPTVGRLDFRVSSNYMTHDDRFRVVYYLPANAKTMHECAHWLEAQGR